MNSEQLRDAIGEVRDDFILDADTVIKKKKSRWPLWAAAAACLCLITVVAVKLLRSPAVNATNATQQWSPSMTAAAYFKTCTNRKDRQDVSSSGSLIMPPYTVTVPLNEERENLEAEGVLPAMPDYPDQYFWAGYNSDGSLYKVLFLWQQRDQNGVHYYSNLHLTAAPKERHEVSDVITVRVDENGNPLPADVTVTERDGVRIIAEGGEQEEKTLTWQTEEGWYQIGGSWNDSYEDVVALLDWFWEHPLCLDRFTEPPEGAILTVSRSEQPDAFREQVPDFTSLGYETQTERINMWICGDGSKPGSVYRLHPVCFEGVYTRGDTVVRWTVSQSADADAWKNCLGRPEEITEEKVKEAISRNGSFNLFFDAPCMATLSIENGTAADAWEIVQSLQN